MTEVIARDDDVATQPGGVSKHLLPPLPYAHAALEPYIDARTMMLHHGKHHASYVEKLNTALGGRRRHACAWRHLLAIVLI